MGFKRPFNGDELQSLTIKQAKVLCNDKMNRFTDPLSEEDTCYKSAGEICNTHQYELHYPSEAPCFPQETDESSPLDVPLETDFTMKKTISSEEAYSYFLFNHSRKQVPLGADYQAVLPPFNAELQSKSGSLVVPREDYSEDHVGLGRKPCSCPDVGSARCVRQHIMEAREKLRVSIGHEKFVNLGFYEMGEEVACHWSEEEEQVFHRVVYSNPSSLGFNIWKHLSEVFPSRTSKEIVSYYFNVFMLRRRASQNRSSILDIDSDDDEWPGLSRRDCRGSKGGEPCATATSNDGSDATVEDSASELFDPKVDGGRKATGEYCYPEDSCMSFEFRGDKSGGKCVQDGGQVYLLDACETKMWDTHCSGSAKEVDLLPTCNIIEEIFGQGNCDMSGHGRN